MGKVMSANFKTAFSDIIFTCVYFPCVKSNHDYVIDASVFIAHIENIFIEHPTAHHCVIGDFNFECTARKVGFNLFQQICSTSNLV